MINLSLEALIKAKQALESKQREYIQDAIQLENMTKRHDQNVADADVSMANLNKAIDFAETLEEEKAA